MIIVVVDGHRVGPEESFSGNGNRLLLRNGAQRPWWLRFPTVPPRVWTLTWAARATGPPILVVDDSSYETARQVRDLDQGLPIDDLDRIEAVTGTIADALDATWLASLTASARARRLNLAAFRYHLVE